MINIIATVEALYGVIILLFLLFCYCYLLLFTTGDIQCFILQLLLCFYACKLYISAVFEIMRLDKWYQFV